MKRIFKLHAAAVLLLANVLFAADIPEVNPAKAREAFLKVVDRPRVPLTPETKPGTDNNREQFTYASEADVRVPGILIKPSAPGRHPAVICAHGTGSKKESNVALMRELAAVGFVAVAIDGRFHGTCLLKGNVTMNVAPNPLPALSARTFPP